MTICISPQSAKEFQQYYQFRHQYLRQPWQQPLGSEQDDLEDISFHRMLVDENQQILAVGRLHQTGQNQGQIRYVAVAPKHQGKGLGKQIMQALEQVAIEVGITEMSLNARENAVEFYHVLNYQNLGFSHCLFNQINHFKMRKKLNIELTEDAKKLTALWHQTIPMSKAMKLNICNASNEKLLCNCDPSFNKNLHNTQFAGSIYTLATLTGWGWVYLQLKQQGLLGDIVLANGEIMYHKPIKGVGFAKVESAQCDAKLSPLAKGRKARVELTAQVMCGDTLGATFTGHYVILPIAK